MELRHYAEILKSVSDAGVEFWLIPTQQYCEIRNFHCIHACVTGIIQNLKVGEKSDKCIGQLISVL